MNHRSLKLSVKSMPILSSITKACQKNVSRGDGNRSQELMRSCCFLCFWLVEQLCHQMCDDRCGRAGLHGAQHFLYGLPIYSVFSVEDLLKLMTAFSEELLDLSVIKHNLQEWRVLMTLSQETIWILNSRRIVNITISKQMALYYVDSIIWDFLPEQSCNAQDIY